MEEREHAFVEIEVAADGSSYFREVPIRVSLTNFSPPAPKIFSSRLTSAQTARVLLLPPGWHTEWHCSPIFQLMVLLSGHVQIEVSNGETRQFGPGDLLLLKDTIGQGHRSATLGAEAVAALSIEMPPEQPITLS